MAGTRWASLSSGNLARASDVNANLAWLEGHHVPMLGGSTTTGVYDLGTSTAQWNKGYFAGTVSAGTFKGDATGLSNAFVLLDQTTTAANGSQVDFTGLSLATGGSYKMMWSASNATSTDSYIYLMVNGDSTTTDYHAQYLLANGATVAAGRENLPVAGYMIGSSSDMNEVTIGLDQRGYATWKAHERQFFATNVQEVLRAGSYNTTGTGSITKLSFVASVANAIAAGSTFKLYKLQ